MSECTTCTYYGKHLDGRAEDMPWPCVECESGEKYVKRGSRKNKVPVMVKNSILIVRIAELEREINRLKESTNA